MHLAQYAPNTSLNTNWEIVQDQHQWMRTAILLLLLLCFAENLINRTTHAYWLITQLSLFLFLWLVRMWCHTFNGPFSGLPRWAGTRKLKQIWILLKQETVSGSGISWTICKSAPRSRHITMPAPHHSVFYRPDALPAAQPTASKHSRHWLGCDILIVNMYLFGLFSFVLYVK